MEFGIATFGQATFGEGQGDISIVVSTTGIKLPINCILADQQYYKTRIDVYDIGPAKVTHKTSASASNVGRLSGDAPSFTTTTNNRGYD